MRNELAIFFENPAVDPLGKEIVEGKVLCSDAGVTIRYKTKDRAFRKNEASLIQLDYSEIESAIYTSSFFGPKILTLTTRNTEKLHQIPGADVAKVVLHVLKDSRDEAQELTNFIEYHQSEAFLKEQDDRMSQSRKDLDL